MKQTIKYLRQFKRWILSILMCRILKKHKYKVVKKITPYLREIKCERCHKQWGMNDNVRVLLPLDDELKYEHKHLSEIYGT